MRKRSKRSRSNDRQAILAGLLAAALVACIGPADAPPGPSTHDPSQASAELVWEESWQDAFQKARSEGRIVVAAFRADWCIWCHRLEQRTLSEPEVSGLLAQRAVVLRLDVDGDDREQVSRHDVRTLPTVIAFSADGSELGRIVGYTRPRGFLRAAETWLGAGS